MLKSYEARIENGQIQWLAEQPQFTSARVIVTVLEEETSPLTKRRMPASLVGKAKILGDIVEPIVGEDEWECLK
ncbi:hypothetical protein [Leptolyngbya ohadii]|uniref:hypothetical protein n=1 Tax=Leptolyngbya ohadii TaxID=1962290 RepID=UPI000B5A014B|nr:hypothetical protein [Leptolyngbya ohadii]